MDVEAQDDGILAKIIVCDGYRESINMADMCNSKEMGRKQSKLVPG
jgi:hypothetical protein